MKQTCAWRFAVVLTLYGVWPVAAGATQPSTELKVAAEFTVSTAWLAARLDDPNVVVLHVGEKEDYEAAHIPGAQLVSVGDISISRGGLSYELPPVEQLTSLLGGLGVGDGRHAVLYVSKAGWQMAGRVFFTLDYLGLGDRTSLLDGGLVAWQSEGRPVTTDVRTAIHRTLTPHLRRAVVDGPWVKEHLGKPGVALIDARLQEFFTGAKPGGKPPRHGHIPGAVNIPFTSVLDETGHFKDRAALGDLFGRSGVRRGDRLAAYCHVGLQGSLVYAVARSLGYDVVLYDGSFEDWSARGWEVVPDKPPVP